MLLLLMLMGSHQSPDLTRRIGGSYVRGEIHRSRQPARPKSARTQPP